MACALENHPHSFGATCARRGRWRRASSRCPAWSPKRTAVYTTVARVSVTVTPLMAYYLLPKIKGLLGDAPLREFAHVLKFSGFAALAAFGRSPADYGRRHPFTFRGRRFELLPLAHPRQSGRLGASNAIYYELHRAWVAAQTTSGL